MTFLTDTRTLFDRLAEAAFGELRPGEELNLNLDAEDQTFVRFNNAGVRQATGATQRKLHLAFQSGGRRAGYAVDLTGVEGWDLETVASLVGHARAETKALPEDPFLVPMQNNGTSDNHYPGELPAAAEIVEEIAGATVGTDFAGLLACGPQIRATRNACGQDHWFSTETLFVDYSLFTANGSGENKAVKGLYADRRWHRDRFEHLAETSRRQLARLRQAARPVPPGSYRVYLAPAAVAEIVGMFSWGAVSYRAWKEGRNALRKLIDGEASLSERFSLKENFGLGLTPQFNSLGEMPPPEIPVIENGRLANLLISSRSAREYGVAPNGAEPGGWEGESLRSPEVGAGLLAEAEILKALDTGLYIGNLHYLNWSDLHNARITGMTRYACFRVENGEIVAPIRDLRFDESLFRMFGPDLEALTAETEVHVATDTYGQRSLGGSKVPGALVGNFRFTL
jgi:predicted Zn-dependent protease